MLLHNLQLVHGAELAATPLVAYATMGIVQDCHPGLPVRKRSGTTIFGR